MCANTLLLESDLVDSFSVLSQVHDRPSLWKTELTGHPLSTPFHTHSWCVVSILDQTGSHEINVLSSVHTKGCGLMDCCHCFFSMRCGLHLQFFWAKESLEVYVSISPMAHWLENQTDLEVKIQWAPFLNLWSVGIRTVAFMDYGLISPYFRQYTLVIAHIISMVSVIYQGIFCSDFTENIFLKFA